MKPEPSDWTFKLRGHRDGAKLLTTELIKQGVVMPYAYKPLHQSVLATASIRGREMSASTRS